MMRVTSAGETREGMHFLLKNCCVFKMGQQSIARPVFESCSKVATVCIGKQCPTDKRETRCYERSTKIINQNMLLQQN